MNTASKLVLSLAAALALGTGAASAQCFKSKQVMASAPEQPATPLEVALLKKKKLPPVDGAEQATETPETTGSVVAQ